MQKTKKEPIVIDAITVIVNLLKEEREVYLPISRVIRLVRYIHKQLIDGKYLDKEGPEVIFNINFNAIKRTVEYNNHFFGLIGDTIYLIRDFSLIENECSIDDKLRGIIRDFCLQEAS